jgi:hypothetical protein
MAPVVTVLQALRGMAMIGAVTLVAEVGDLTRFENPGDLMSHLGLVPLRTFKWSNDPPGRHRRGIGAHIGDLVEPLTELRIEIVEVAKASAEKEVLADAAERTFALALRLRPIRLARLGQVTVVARERQQRAIVDDVAGLGILPVEHRWARKLTALGHNVRLIPPKYVRPFVKRAKNDRNDAEAICEAAGRPGVRFVLAKSAEQQAQGMVLKVRETLVGQRTQLVNALPGHAAEFGVIAAKGISRVASLLEAIEVETTIPLEGPARCSPCLARRLNTLTPAQRDRSEVHRDAQGQCDQPTAGHHPGDWSDHCADTGDRG